MSLGRLGACRPGDSHHELADNRLRGVPVDDSLISVASLHALAYCERLFYLEEVERLRVADAAVYAGRRLHVEIADDDGAAVERLEFENGELGIRGAVDVLRMRSGELIPYEHKRGKSAGTPGAREAWRSDRIQIGAYSLLVEAAHACTVPEGRVRYHADNVTVRVPIDEQLRDEVRSAIERARVLRESIERPPVTDNDRLCTRCSLAPLCLPEEARLGARNEEDGDLVRLLPQHPDGQTVHVLESGAVVGRSGHQLVIRGREQPDVHCPVAEVGQIVIHGYAQITTQALQLCAERGIGVHWMTFGGNTVGSLAPTLPSAQRHLRQFHALTDAARCLELAKRLVLAKVESQLRYVLRSTQGKDRRGDAIERLADRMRDALRRVSDASSADALLGYEGTGAAAYFEALPFLLSAELGEEFTFDGRNRQPPRDRVNAILSFGYGMLYREVLQAVVAVGLHAGVGFYHRPRSSAHPLALDMMELFRVPIVDMAVVPAINRRTFDPVNDFNVLPGRVLLSDSGRKKVIEVIERRKADTWKHSVVGYSLSYARLIELEVRLLEKEWMGEGGLFAKFRLR
jgi:CRISP-associated protein Cas1